SAEHGGSQQSRRVHSHHARHALDEIAIAAVSVNQSPFPQVNRFRICESRKEKQVNERPVQKVSCGEDGYRAGMQLLPCFCLALLPIRLKVEHILKCETFDRAILARTRCRK